MAATKTAAKNVKKNAVVVADAPRRGRPPVFTGKKLRTVVTYLKRHQSLTYARQFLASEQGIEISMVTIGKIAKENNITMTLGRPAWETAAA